MIHKIDTLQIAVKLYNITGDVYRPVLLLNRGCAARSAQAAGYLAHTQLGCSKEWHSKHRTDADQPSYATSLPAAFHACL